MDHLAHCDRLAEEVERFAAAVGGLDPTAPVPSCPEWTAYDLALHLGTVHRWAEHLVRVRATERIGASNAVVDPGPPTPEWLREGGARLVSTLRAADPDEAMWAWGPDQHVRFWSRRQLHETLVHRIDAEVAGGLPSTADPAVAADAIDELLVNLGPAVRFSPGVARLRGEGEQLAVRPNDTGERWTITLEPDGFTVAARDGAPEVTLWGRAADLLCVLYRRRSVEEAHVAVEGNAALAHFWLAHSALE